MNVEVSTSHFQLTNNQKKLVDEKSVRLDKFESFIQNAQLHLSLERSSHYRAHMKVITKGKMENIQEEGEKLESVIEKVFDRSVSCLSRYHSRKVKRS